MTLVINGIEVKDVPIKSKGIQFDKEGKKEKYVDSKGKVVQKVKIQGSEYKWCYEDGTECVGKSYKSLNGKPIKPFSRTTIIKNYDTINVTELPYFINNDLTYLLVSDKFKSMMKEIKGQAYSFKFVNRGFKIYRAVAYYDEQLDKVLMRCFQGDLRKVELKEREEVDEIESEEVESIDLGDLEV